jgi:hypothetical protein
MVWDTRLNKSLVNRATLLDALRVAQKTNGDYLRQQLREEQELHIFRDIKAKEPEVLRTFQARYLNLRNKLDEYTEQSRSDDNTHSLAMNIELLLTEFQKDIDETTSSITMPKTPPVLKGPLLDAQRFLQRYPVEMPPSLKMERPFLNRLQMQERLQLLLTYKKQISFDSYKSLPEEEQLSIISSAVKINKPAHFFNEILNSLNYMQLSTAVKVELAWAYLEHFPLGLWHELQAGEQLTVLARARQEFKPREYFTEMLDARNYTESSRAAQIELALAYLEHFPFKLWCVMQAYEHLRIISRSVLISKPVEFFREMLEEGRFEQLSNRVKSELILAYKPSFPLWLWRLINEEEKSDLVTRALQESKPGSFFSEILENPDYASTSKRTYIELIWAYRPYIPLGLWRVMDAEEQSGLVSRALQESKPGDFFSEIFMEQDYASSSKSAFVELSWAYEKLFPLVFWQKLTTNEKLPLIYRVASESRQNWFFAIKHDDILLVNSALAIIFKGVAGVESEKPFSSFHSQFEKWVTGQAWASSEPIDVGLLLPHCDGGLGQNFYCEGRRWLRKDEQGNLLEDRGVYCPRKKTRCTVSRIEPDLSRKWDKWSLLELFAVTQIVPELPRLKESEQYIPKLCGWVNRLNEIRGRLKCSKCGAFMLPDMAYAKFLAKFNATVMKCANGEDHDKVYLNECWACEGIIDSRESRHQVEDYYVCILCGSGPMRSNQYTQGDSCPKCGTKGAMRRVGDSRYWVCSMPSCQHKIWLPKNERLTGPHKSERQHGYQKKSTS